LVDRKILNFICVNHTFGQHRN